MLFRSGDSHPAACDNGPAVSGKGNIYSPDGENWYELYNESNPDKYNYNFILSAVVSSESGSLIYSGSAGVPEQRSEIIIKKGSAHSHMLERSFVVNGASASSPDHATYNLRNDVSTRSSFPAAFPEITNFRIYRCRVNTCTAFKEVDASVTTYMDNTSLGYSYVVTALYGDIESEYSNMVPITHVGLETDDTSVDLFPSRFFSYVSLKGHEHVARVDIISVSGKICLVVNKPGETIDTSSLQPGLYFFRISDSNGRRKVVKAIKAN